MHSTQKGKWLDVSTSFPRALACGTSARLHQEFCVAHGYRSSVDASASQRQPAWWSVSHEVKETESQGWDRTRCCIRRCEAGTTFPCCAVAVYLSSIMLKWCLHLLACLSAQDIYGAGVIRAGCSGRSAVAPGVLRSVFTHFSMKDSCKK